MKYILIFLIGLITQSSFSQNEEETIVFTNIGKLTEEQLDNAGPTKLKSHSDLKTATEYAKLDIENGITFLLLKGGLAPVIIATDPEFEKKYGIYFYEYGCVGPDESVLEEYNKIIFDFLTEKFGSTWTKEVRDDVVGLKSWMDK